jgi:hypothetical protein
MLLVGTRSGLVDLDDGRRLAHGSVTALALGPTGWHALLDGRTVVRIEPGATVRTVGELADPDGQSLGVLADGTVVVGRRGARLTALGAGVRDLDAFERVPGRSAWKNPAAPTPDSRSIATSGADLWLNVHVGGLWHSPDGGASWTGRIEADADVHEVRADGQWVAVAAAAGFGWSRDRGDSWSWTTEGLHAHYLRAAAFDAGRQVFYVSASDGPFTGRGAVYRAAPGSAFVRCRGGLPEWFPGNVDSGHLDAAAGRVAVGFGDEVHVSEDEGGSWRTVAIGAAVSAVRIAA